MELDTEQTQAPERTGRSQWTLMGAMGIGHAVVHWYQQGFIVIFPTIKEDMALSATRAGLIITMRALISALVNIPAGTVTDRLRGHWPAILALSVFGAALGYLLVGISPVYIVLLFTVGLAGTHPTWHLPAIAALSERYPQRRGFALSIHGMGATLGDTVGPPVLGLLLVVLTWRQAMAFSALPAFLLSGVVFLVMRRLMDGPVEKKLPDSSDQTGKSTSIALVRELLRNRRLLGLVVASGLRAGSQQTLVPFLAIYFKEDLAMSDPVIGLHLGLLTFLGIFSSPVLGLLSDRLGRKPVLVFGFLTIASLVMALAVVGGGWKLTLVVALIGVFVYALSAVILAMAQDQVGEGVRATATGFIFTGNMAFSTVAPIIGGVLVDVSGDTRAAFFLAATLLSLAATVIAIIPAAPGGHRVPSPAKEGAS